MPNLNYESIFNETDNKIASFVVQIKAKMQLTVPKKLRRVIFFLPRDVIKSNTIKRGIPSALFDS